MDLVIKLYNEQPPRIGIKFKYEYLALRSYEEIIRNHRGQAFMLNLELAKGKINLLLTSEENGVKIPYKDLDYKNDQLIKLQAYAEKNQPLEFVHIFPKSNSLFVAKPFREATFIQISSFQIHGEHFAGTH